MKKYYRPADIILYLVFVCLIVWAVVSFSGISTSAELVHIKSDAGDFWYSLNEERDLTVYGPLGDTEIHIRNGSVYVEDSPCRDKLCVHAAPLSVGGAWNACLPNKVFIEVRAESEKTSDDKIQIDGLGY